MTARLNFLFWLASLTLIACQTAPTKLYETQSPQLKQLVHGAQVPIVLTDTTIVFDARSAFDYALAHIPGSIHLRWQDFAQVRGPFPGRLHENLEPQARRLALLGVTPESHIVVVDEGIKGAGEAGRLAWTLYYMGISNIQVASIQYFEMPFSNVEPPPRKNTSFWEPVVVPSVTADKEEVMLAITKKGSGKTHLLDVRSTKEYFKKAGLGGGYVLPDLQAVNIEWREFYDEKSGRPKLSMRERLKQTGINPQDRVITISNRGIRSAAATFALLTLGFENAANYSAGIDELVSRRAGQ